MIENRATLWLLVKRDLKVRYSDSVLGYFWSVLDPLLMSGIYYFVFVIIMNRGSEAESPYIVFLLLALLPWLWFNTAVNEGGKALQTQSRLVRSTPIPRELWVLRSVLAKGIEFAFALPVLVVFLFIYQPSVNGHIWLFGIGIVLQLTLLTGIALFLAPMVILLKDLDPLIRIGLRFLFYASPVLYGLTRVFNESIDPLIQQLYILNPLTGILSAYRAGFFPEQLSWQAIGTSAVISVLTLVLGWWVFAKNERTVLKEM